MNNIGIIPTGFDRSAPCGCRWSSRLHGNECPEHGMPVNSAVVLTPEDITRIHVEMDDDWHEAMARPVTLSPAGGLSQARAGEFAANPPDLDADGE